MEKFLIIDGNSIMNRAFYGLSGAKMTNKEGIHTNAIFGFLNTYWLMLDKLKPEYVAVSFDLKAPTFRHKLYTDYKGTRKGMPEELKEQMPLIKDVLDAMNIPILQLETYEADDILGTVANKNTLNNIFTYILTGDRDSFQLISPTTNIVMPSNKNKTDYTIYTEDLLKEKFNILPSQVIEVKSLMGDTSDNIPGVRGVGEKTAYSLIWENENLDSIYKNIDNLKISEKLKEKLVNDKDMAYLSHTLATIDINVPIELDYEKCKLKDIDTKRLYNMFKTLEFSKFMNKYDFSSEIENDEKEKSASLVDLSVPTTIIVDDTNIDEKYNNIIDILNKDKISYIFNTNARLFESFKSILGIENKNYLAIYSNDKNISYIIDLDNLANKDILKEFCTSRCNKLSYNIKQDLRYFFDLNIDNLVGFNYDVMIAYYLMDSTRSDYSIEYIINDLFEYEIKRGDKKKNDVQLSLFDQMNINEKDENAFLTDEDISNINACLKGIYLSHSIVISKLKELNMMDLFETIEMPLVETLANMEHVGMYIDLEKLDMFSTKLKNRMEILEKEIYELAGEEFNINSTQQLGTVLFDKLDLPALKKTKTGYSTEKEVLEILSDRHPIVNKVIEYRQIVKLHSTFVEGLKNTIKSDNRIHTTFMQTVTSTGRLSSVEPNLQNIPVRLELGREIRTFFAGENSNVIVDADYSQIELRVLAHISDDSTMISAFKNNIDVHKVTASQVFDVPLDEVTSTMRTHAKAVNFGIVYGISDFGLAKNISSSKKEAAQYIENYLKKYSGIARFMENIVKEAKINGYVSTLFGRRRYIPELKQKNKMVVQFGERVAMNTPIQGTAADIIKLAMNKIYKELKNKKLKSKLVMQVHDELIIETVPEEVEEVSLVMKKAMENVVKLSVPLDIDLNVGKTWYDAK